MYSLTLSNESGMMVKKQVRHLPKRSTTLVRTVFRYGLYGENSEVIIVPQIFLTIAYRHVWHLRLTELNSS